MRQECRLRVQQNSVENLLASLWSTVRFAEGVLSRCEQKLDWLLHLHFSPVRLLCALPQLVLAHDQLLRETEVRATENVQPWFALRSGTIEHPYASILTLLTHPWKHTHAKGAPESLMQTHLNTKQTNEHPEQWERRGDAIRSLNLGLHTHTPNAHTHSNLYS